MAHVQRHVPVDVDQQRVRDEHVSVPSRTREREGGKLVARQWLAGFRERRAGGERGRNRREDVAPVEGRRDWLRPGLWTAGVEPPPPAPRGGGGPAQDARW